MMTLFFTREKTVSDWESAAKSDTNAYARFFHAALDHGLYFAPSQFEAAFVSAAHTDSDIDFSIDAVKKILDKVNENR
jgi:glutamate-1-semialdehyde 2,1-aminomutase